MIEVKGKFNTAKVYTDNVEGEAISQITELCNQEFVKDSKIRIMPDTHAGAGCTIGTTMTIQDKIVPNLVGVDIGCGMEVVKLYNKELDFQKLDEVIRKHIPSGFNVRTKVSAYGKMTASLVANLKCISHMGNTDRDILSVGTLGGGNHFIEVNQDKDGSLYLVIHSGSRNLGKKVADFYQAKAYNEIIYASQAKENLIKEYKTTGRDREIEAAVADLMASKPRVRKELAYLEGQDFKDYLHDMQRVQAFATLNRKAMADTILHHMKLDAAEIFTTIHNYIDINTMILRKGAISAQKDEKVLIPINMRDGSIIAIGKGNEDWNCSAPHGAGRLMSRSQAKRDLNIEAFQKEMSSVWTSSVSAATLDEAPMAYKPMEEIITNVKDTVDIVDIIKPLYNFKAS